jgi:hypothetical protein
VGPRDNSKGLGLATAWLDGVQSLRRVLHIAGDCHAGDCLHGQKFCSTDLLAVNGFMFQMHDAAAQGRPAAHLRGGRGADTRCWGRRLNGHGAACRHLDNRGRRRMGGCRSGQADSLCALLWTLGMCVQYLCMQTCCCQCTKFTCILCARLKPWYRCVLHFL